MVIAFANLKGGVGKTTLALHFAEWIRRAGRNVEIAELDTQASLRQLHDITGAIKTPIVPELRTPENGAWVIVDTPPYISASIYDTLRRSSSAIIVPCRPSLPDILAAIETRKALGDAAKRAAVVLNFTKHTGKEHLQYMREAASRAGFHVFEHSLTDRLDYARALTIPGLLWALDNEKAIVELDKVFVEIVAWITTLP